jgi:hypothetical protein
MPVLCRRGAAAVCAPLANLVLFVIMAAGTPPTPCAAGTATQWEQRHRNHPLVASWNLVLRGGSDSAKGEDAAGELVKRIMQGGEVRLEAGDHFCGENDGVIRLVRSPFSTRIDRELLARSACAAYQDNSSCLSHSKTCRRLYRSRRAVGNSARLRCGPTTRMTDNPQCASGDHGIWGRARRGSWKGGPSAGKRRPGFLRHCGCNLPIEHWCGRSRRCLRVVCRLPPMTPSTHPGLLRALERVVVRRDLRRRPGARAPRRRLRRRLQARRAPAAARRTERRRRGRN